MEYRLTAIVLGKREVGETDRLYTFYSREMGKVRAKAIGVRKPTAKLAGQLETLSLVGFTLVRNRGMGRVSGAIAEEVFSNIRADYDTLRITLDTLSVFDRLVGLDEPDGRIFDALLEYLTLLDKVAARGEEGKAVLLSEAFLVRLLDTLGYRIEADACAVSGGRFESGSRCFFSPEAGGIVAEKHAGRYAVAISENAVKLIRLFLGNRLPSMLRVRVGEQDVAELSRVRKLFIDRVVR
jgi:DNA repair protein RecO (recombination protein O)